MFWGTLVDSILLIKLAWFFYDNNYIEIENINGYA